MIQKKPALILAISVLMLVATAPRALIQAFEINSRYIWLIAGLLVLFSILLFTELAIYRRFHFYLNIYFVLQASIIVILLLIPVDPPDTPVSYDFFGLLSIPLLVQAIFYFPRPKSFYWVISLTVTAIAALHIQYGLFEGLKYSMTFLLGYAMVFLLAIFYIDAEEAKTELNKANHKLQEYYAKAEVLAIAEERNRLARDLHDSVTQSLYSMTLFAEAASEELTAGKTDTVGEHLKELRQTSQQALQEMRLMIFELRPPELDKKGLALALKERLEAVEMRAGIETEFSMGFEERLPSNVERGLYNIAREAMNNILKHAQATKTAISLKREGGKVVFQIWDNGIGFEQSAENFNAGLGIRGMQERADQLGALLSLAPGTEGGTRLTVEVPDDGHD